MLEELLSKLPKQYKDPNLLVGNENADDAAVYQLNAEQAIIATTDFFMPIVDDPYDFGRMAAANALSDVYAMGGKPIMALAIAGIPAGKIPAETVQQIFAGGHDVCAEAGVPVAGGHTKAELDDDGYQQMVSTATRLNKVGADLAELDGVHAMTDVTGFGLLGHLLEMCRGAGVKGTVELANVPVLPAGRTYAECGYNTGASGRNWASYGEDVRLPQGVSDADLNLLRDPQTSGGLLVACTPESADEVVRMFHAQGHAEACVMGRLSDGDPIVEVV